MRRISWEEYVALDVSQRIPFLSKDEAEDEPFHVLYAQQFDRAMLDQLCGLADHIRRLHKSPDGAKFLMSLLSSQAALNLFAQPSTRTFMSFQLAEQKLGMQTSDIRDISTSSQAKGETLQNSIRTFSSYVDLIVMRHPDGGAAELAAYEMNMADRRIPVINGGSGQDQHPTQALLDIYTLQKSLGGIDGKKIAMVGDLMRGRTVRSLSYLMKNYEDVELYYVAPERLRIGDDIKSFLERLNIPFTESDSIDKVVPIADAIYMTRIQWEWDKASGASFAQDGQYDPRFCFRAEHLDKMKPNSCLMHPLPKINEIDPLLDYIDDPRIVYWRQERNGMWIRAALIARIFDMDKVIMGKKPDELT
jgi:aspartate carbamoyltransferase catalytic subunit